MWQEKSSSNVQKAETWPTAFHPWSPSHFWSWITLALLWTHFTLAGKIMLSVKGEFMRWKSLMCCWFSIMGWCLSDLQALREKPTGSNNKRHHLASRTKTLHYNQKYKTMKLRSKVPVDKSQWQHDEDWRVSTRSQKRSNSEGTRHKACQQSLKTAVTCERMERMAENLLIHNQSQDMALLSFSYSSFNCTLCYVTNA